MDHDAFISYSHAADSQLAPRLQDGLQRLAKPWWRRRALRVFRDTTGLTANPGLWSSIQSAMDDSRFFVFLASPASAASPWVERELSHWLSSRGPESVLPVLTEGTWVWDDAAGAFDLGRSTAVPAVLASAFTEEPRHVDLTWARSEEQVDLRNGRFRDQVAEIAAPIHGIAKDDLEGADVREHRRTLRWAWTAAVALVLLTFLSLAAGATALRNADEAALNARRAAAQRTVADRNAGEARRQGDAAKRNASEADAQRAKAQRNADEAKRQGDAAQQNAEDSARNASEADAQRAEAERQGAAAQQNAVDADAQRAAAERNAADAKRQGAAARASATEADAQRSTAERNAAQAAASERSAKASESSAVSAQMRAEAAAAAESIARRTAQENAERARVETQRAEGERVRAESALGAEQQARNEVTSRATAFAALDQADEDAQLSLLLAIQASGEPDFGAVVRGMLGGRALSAPAGSSPATANRTGRNTLIRRMLALGGTTESFPLERFENLALSAAGADANGVDERVVPVVSPDGQVVVNDVDHARFMVRDSILAPWRTVPYPPEIASVGNAMSPEAIAGGGRVLLLRELVPLPSDGAVAGATYRDVIRGVDLVSGSQLFAREVNAVATGFGVSPDQRFIALWTDYDCADLAFYDAFAMTFTAEYGCVTPALTSVSGRLSDATNRLYPGIGYGYDVSAGFSDDSRWFGGTVAGSAVLWDMQASGTVQRQLSRSGGAGFGPGVSPDGSVAVAFAPRAPAPADAPPEGPREEYELNVFSIADGSVLRTIPLSCPGDLLWAEDGSALAVAASALIDTSDWTSIDLPSGCGGDWNGRRFSSDSRSLIINSGLEVESSTIIDVATGQETWRREYERVIDVTGGDRPCVISERNEYDGLSAGYSPNRLLRMSDLETGAAKFADSGFAEIRGFARSPDGRRLAVSTADGRMRVLDLGSCALPIFAAPAPPFNAGFPFFTHDGSTLVGVGVLSGASATPEYWAAVWDLRQVGVGRPLGVSDLNYEFLRAGPDAGTVIGRLDDGRCVVVDTGSGAETPFLVDGVWSACAMEGFSPDGRTYVRVGFGEEDQWGQPTIAHYDIVDVPGGSVRGTVRGPIVRYWPETDVANHVSFSGDGRRLAVVTGSFEVSLLDTASLAVASVLDLSATWPMCPPNPFQLDRPDPAPCPIAPLEVDPSGDSIAAYGLGQVHLYDTSTGALAWRVDSGAVDSIAFSPDGRKLAVRSSSLGLPFVTRPDRGLRVLSTEDGSTVVGGPLPTDELGPYVSGRPQVIWSPDGSLLFDGERRLLDPDTLETLGDLKYLNLNIGRFVLRFPYGMFMPDGSLLAKRIETVPQRMEVSVKQLRIDLSTAALTDRACEMVGRNLTRQEWDRFVGTPDYRAVCPQYPT